MTNVFILIDLQHPVLEQLTCVSLRFLLIQNISYIFPKMYTCISEESTTFTYQRRVTGYVADSDFYTQNVTLEI